MLDAGHGMTFEMAAASLLFSRFCLQAVVALGFFPDFPLNL
jgi:hypothetical protein